MPRKRKLNPEKVCVLVGGNPTWVTLYPPTGRKKSWYAYWKGQTYAVGTGQTDRDAAVSAVEWRLKNPEGHLPSFKDMVLTDDEFRAIQKEHFGKKTEKSAKARAEKSLKNCLEAISAFKLVTGLANVVLATRADCEGFQRAALELPKNWRHKHKRNPTVERVSPNTIVKWSRELRAAFERANRNAPPKKRVWSIAGASLDERSLLTSNPWTFNWIEGYEREPQHFSPQDLLSLLTFLETKWKPVTAGAIACKVLLWSWSRKLEMTSLTWDSYREVDGEHHFQTVGKRGVKKWFRIPDGLYRELRELQTTSPLLFAKHSDQLRAYHADNPNFLRHVKDFSPQIFGQWLYKRVKEWAASAGKQAYVHIFRKTAMQHVLSGEVINKKVAKGLHVSTSVMLNHYTTEDDAKLRGYSNATYDRLIAALPPEVARRYGYAAPARPHRDLDLQTAVAFVNELAARLCRERRSNAV